MPVSPNEIRNFLNEVQSISKDLDIGMVLLLDGVQKYAKGITDKQISRDQHKILKENRLVEGRYPRLYFQRR
jgi:hypothetical protein